MILTRPQPRILSLLLFLFYLSVASHSADAQTVYVTKTGKKYHKEDCRYLKYSKYAVSLQEAKDKYYTACLVCKPSTTISKDQVRTDSPSVKKYNPTIRKAVASRCTATTKTGTRCKRTTKNTSGRCWQHE